METSWSEISHRKLRRIGQCLSTQRPGWKFGGESVGWKRCWWDPKIGGSPKLWGSDNQNESKLVSPLKIQLNIWRTIWYDGFRTKRAQLMAR